MRLEQKANWLHSQPKKNFITGLENYMITGYGILAPKNHNE